MMKNKNFGQSIRAKLLNIARAENVGYQSLLTRYFQERLLYRLSISEYKEHFILKGGALIYAYEQLKARPTLDIDFLGNRINRDEIEIRKIFKTICGIKSIEDGVVFNIDSISTEEITINREYNGVRVHVDVSLDTASQVLSMDIGFGDVITPAPVELSYPTLIEQLPEVEVLAYSLETVVAEKFHAMLEHSVENSRMKDFFDVYRILNSGTVKSDVLQEAISATMKRRKFHVGPEHSFFEQSFALDKDRNVMWKNYLLKIKYKDQLSFYDVWKLIVTALKPFVLD